MTTFLDEPWDGNGTSPADGDNLTTSNTLASGWTNGYVGASPGDAVTPDFDFADPPPEGVGSARFGVQDFGQTSGGYSSYWAPGGVTGADRYLSFWVHIDADACLTALGEIPLLQVWDAGNATVRLSNLNTTDGYNARIGGVIGTVDIPHGAWHRWDIHYTSSTIEVDVYNTSGTLLDNVSTTHSGFGSGDFSIGAVEYWPGGAVDAPSFGNVRIGRVLWEDTAPAPVSSGETGTVAVSLGGATVTAAGTPDVSGVATSSLGAVTVTVSGVPDVGGVTTVTLGGATVTVSGVPDVGGTVTVSLGGATVAAAGSSTPAGAGTVTVSLGGATVTATGTPDVAGSVSVSLGGATVTVAGTPDVAGTVAVSLGAVTVTAGTTVDVDSVTNLRVGWKTGRLMVAAVTNLETGWSAGQLRRVP